MAEYVTTKPSHDHPDGNTLLVTRRDGEWALVKTGTHEAYKLYHAPVDQHAASIPNNAVDPVTPSERGVVRLSYRRGLRALASVAAAFPALGRDNRDQLRALLAFCKSDEHRKAIEPCPSTS